MRWSFSAAALVLQGLFALSVWMYSRSDATGARLQRIDGAESIASKVKTLCDDFTRMEQTLERARDKYSEVEGRNNTIFGNFQSDLVEMKAKLGELERLLGRSEQDRREIWQTIRDVHPQTERRQHGRD